MPVRDALFEARVVLERQLAGRKDLDQRAATILTVEGAVLGLIVTFLHNGSARSPLDAVVLAPGLLLLVVSAALASSSFLTPGMVVGIGAQGLRLAVAESPDRAEYRAAMLWIYAGIIQENEGHLERAGKSLKGSVLAFVAGVGLVSLGSTGLWLAPLLGGM